MTTSAGTTTLNGKREHITPCQKGGKTYEHDVTTIDCQVHDDKLNEAFAAKPISYEGCTTAFLKTDRVKHYTRPDGKLYEVIVDAGQPFEKKGNYCKTVHYGGIIETVSVVISSTQRTCFSQGDSGNPGSTTTREDAIGYYKLVHTGTGETIATNLKSVRSSSTSTVTGTPCHDLG